MNYVDRLRAWIAKQPQPGASGGGNHTGLDLFMKAMDEIEQRHEDEKERLIASLTKGNGDDP